MAEKVIGVKLAIGGEKEFKKAISGINTDIKILGSEMKKIEAEYKGNENSLSALTAKSEKYGQIAEAQRKKVETLRNALESSRTKYTEAGKNVDKYRQELADAQNELEKLKSSESATTEEVEQQEKAVAELTKKLNTAEKGYESAEKRTKNWEISLNRAEAELSGTERELGNVNAKIKELGSNSRYSAEQIKNAESTLGDFGRKAQPIANAAKNALKTVTAVTAAAAGTAGLVAKKSIDIGSAFESQMSKVQSVSGATAGELAALRSKAKEMGSTTKFTASQAGEALEYMAMAGWKTADMLSGIDGVMSLAAASGEDLGKTSDIVTDALTAFGMKASDAGHFADVLAAASSNANTNVGMMGETFKYVGAAAGALHYSAEDVGLSIGLMANSGIKASQAGTELNSIYTRLAVNTSHARDEIEGLGIEFYNADGSARAWGKILDEMRVKTAKMTDAEKTAFANHVAGQRAQAGLLAMLDATKADYDKLADSINNADGAAKRMADTMDDNLNGQITKFKSGLEGTAITIYEEMQKPLTEGVKTAITTLNDPRIQAGVQNIGKQFGEAISGGAALAAKYAPDFIKGFQKVTDYLSSSSFKSGVKAGGELLLNTGKIVVDVGKVGLPVLSKGLELTAKSGKVLIPVLAAGYAGFKTFQIVRTVTGLIQGAGTAFQALNVIMAANPWALAIGGAAMLVTGLVALNATLGKSEDKYADLRREIDETADSMGEMEQARKDAYDEQYKEIYQVEKLRDRLDELVDKNGKLKGSKEELKSVTDKLNKSGFEVELDKTGTLIKNYKDLKKEIDEYIERKHITAKLDALEPEYNQHSVNIESYTADTLKKKAEYEKAQADFEKKFGIKYGSKEFIDLYENSSLKTQGKEWKEAVKLIEAYGDAWSQAFRKEDEAIKMINAVDEANALFAAGKYDEANKVLSDYFEERANLFKKASDYEKEQRAQAIDDLGNQLLEQMDLYKVATIEESQGMMDLALSYVQKTADELKKIGIEIPDGIIEGLKNGTLSVDDAMKQIQEIIKNSGQVDLTEEGVEISDTLSDGLKLGIDTVAGAGAELVDSAVKPMGAPTPISEAKQAGQDTGDAYADGVKGKSGAAEDAGASVSDSAVKGLGSSEGDAGNEGRKTGTQFSGGIDSQKGKAKQAGLDAGDAAVKGLISAKTSASTGGQGIGGAFASGITHGMNIKLPSIRIAASSLITTALNAAKKAAGINSPSKKAMDMVGKPIPQGVAVGIEKGAPDAARRAANATNSIIDKMKSQTASAAERLNAPTQPRGFDMSLSDLKNVLSGGRNITVNYENTFNSAAVRDGEALLRQLDRALGAKL